MKLPFFSTLPDDLAWMMPTVGLSFANLTISLLQSGQGRAPGRMGPSFGNNVFGSNKESLIKKA